jgi:type 1 glutamine amidotransferase
VFFLMLGHDSKAWKNPNYPEILSRGIRWAAGR